MPTETRTCNRCARPTSNDGANLCGGCLDTLLTDLREVDDLFHDLLVTRTKQDVITRESARVSGSRERALGYRPGALTAADELTAVLRFWARTISSEWEERLTREHQATHYFTLPADGNANAHFLRTAPNLIRFSQHAADIVDQIGYAVTKARNVCDRPAERRYAGTCRDCHTDLYVREQDTHITCQGCGVVYRAEERWTELLTELRDRIATAADIAAGIGRLHGQPLARKTINQWHSRGRLLARAHTADGYPMFRIGDVLDLARRPTRGKSPAVPPRTRAKAVSPCTC